MKDHNAFELNHYQMAQQDAVDNAIVEFINTLEAERVQAKFPGGLDYTDMSETVHEIRDILISLYDETGIMPEIEFYPYVEHEE